MAARENISRFHLIDLILEFHNAHSTISNNVPFYNKKVLLCIFLLQNGALWDIRLMHCGICEMTLLGYYWFNGWSTEGVYFFVGNQVQVSWTSFMDNKLLMSLLSFMNDRWITNENLCHGHFINHRKSFSIGTVAADGQQFQGRIYIYVLIREYRFFPLHNVHIAYTTVPTLALHCSKPSYI